MSLDPSIQRMLEQYRNIPLPLGDKLREILQQSALLGLARHQFFEHAAFYGGTALRILYGLDRFSEDLDFSLLSPNPEFDLTPYLEGLCEEMQSFGFEVDVSQKEKKQGSAIVSAFLKTNTLNLFLSIQSRSDRFDLHPEQKIRVKLEIDTDPPPGFTLETKLVLNPIPFYVLTYELSDLFAGKMHALLCRGWKKRVKGRDWYDFVWFMKKGVPLSLNHLKERMHQTGHLKNEESFTVSDLHSLLQSKIASIDWEQAKKDVSPFVSDPRQIDLWSALFFQEIAKEIQVKPESPK